MPVTIHWLVTTPRLPAGLLSAQAWELLRSGEPVYAATGDRQTDALRTAGVAVTELPTAEAVTTLLERGGVWIATAAEDEPVAAAVSERLVADPSVATLELTVGSWDPPGARLLDAVAVIDRLRSPGGCPWDAALTHASLAPFMLEEAYETVDAIDSGDLRHLREELGDLLMQPLFHARLAAEDDETGFTIDDVAGDAVDKLVRRHPHVFAGEPIDTADGMPDTWEDLKRREKPDRRYAVDGVALGQPALSLAAKFLARSARAGVDVPLRADPVESAEPDPGGSAHRTTSTSEATVDAETTPTGSHAPDSVIDAESAAASEPALGAALLRLVAAAQRTGIDPELALRKAALDFAARSRAVEDSRDQPGLTAVGLRPGDDVPGPRGPQCIDTLLFG